MLAAVAIAAALGAVAPAEAAGDPDWQALAQCESGGNPGANTGNGYYGLYQFDHGTWIAHGGGRFADNAHQASREQQTMIAKRLHATRGTQPWPACSKRIKRDTGGGKVRSEEMTSRRFDNSRSAKPMLGNPAAKNAPHSASGAVPSRPGSRLLGPGHPPTPLDTSRYVVVPGDTLSGIAERLHVPGGWRAIYARNSSVIHDPNEIFPGQRFATR
ncbi:transglycosylase family protein [Amycolatopsis anabasis]|uniref:transglycosylase family protein n=1 Tax=Amycolatopsis anabasis TaxID=1840409 RepID=UPI003CCE4D4F